MVSKIVLVEDGMAKSLSVAEAEFSEFDCFEGKAEEGKLLAVICAAGVATSVRAEVKIGDELSPRISGAEETCIARLF